MYRINNHSITLVIGRRVKRNLHVKNKPFWFLFNEKMYAQHVRSGWDVSRQMWIYIISGWSWTTIECQQLGQYYYLTPYKLSDTSNGDTIYYMRMGEKKQKKKNFTTSPFCCLSVRRAARLFSADPWINYIHIIHAAGNKRHRIPLWKQ